MKTKIALVMLLSLSSLFSCKAYSDLSVEDFATLTNLLA